MAPAQPTSVLSAEDGDMDPYVNPFENELSRRHFVMKVYGLLCICISVTVVHVALVLYSTPFRNYLFQNRWIFWVCFILYFITSLIVACCLPVLRNQCAGILILVILVESLSVICAMITMYYETHIILAAAIGTALLCYLVTIVAIFMPIDLTNCSFILTVMGILFFLFLLISSIVSIFLFVPILQLVVAFVSVLVFAVYMTLTTQLILGGKTFQFEEDDFIAAAIFLYVDIIIIFINFLTIFDFLCQ